MLYCIRCDVYHNVLYVISHNVLYASSHNVLHAIYHSVLHALYHSALYAIDVPYSNKYYILYAILMYYQSNNHTILCA